MPTSGNQEILKTAKTALVKAYRSGKVSLKAVEEASKVLKNKPRQLKHLGTGGEGVATLMTNPKHGANVMKSFDTESNLFSPENFYTKQKVWKATKNNPEFTNYHGQKGNKPVTYHEYVPKEITKTIDPDGSIIVPVKNKARGVLSSKGQPMVDDLHRGNFMQTPKNETKIIDFLTSEPRFSSPKHKAINVKRLEQDRMSMHRPTKQNDRNPAKQDKAWEKYKIDRTMYRAHKRDELPAYDEVKTILRKRNLGVKMRREFRNKLYREARPLADRDVDIGNLKGVKYGMNYSKGMVSKYFNLRHDKASNEYPGTMRDMARDAIHEVRQQKIRVDYHTKKVKAHSGGIFDKYKDAQDYKNKGMAQAKGKWWHQYDSYTT